MRVLNVADPSAVISRDAVGSAEQLIAALDSALVDAGHDSLVVAAAGSHCNGELIDVPTTGRNEIVAQVATRARLARVLANCPVDLVHLHGHDVLGLLPHTDVPVLATLHQPPAWYPTRLFSADQSPVRFSCVSHSQRRCFFADTQVDVITNGIDLTLYQPMGGKEPYVAALGTICPQKGFHLALEAARLAHVPARLAGSVSSTPSHQQYFRDSIVPRLDAERVFVGPVGGLARRAFLARARALIVPSLIDETSSLAAMEAMACGTPVIAMRRGALPEIVEDGVTGILVDGFLDLVDAIAAVCSISPATCRAEAERRFDARVMKDAYLSLYERILDDAPLARTPAVRAVPGRSRRDANGMTNAIAVPN